MVWSSWVPIKGYQHYDSEWYSVKLFRDMDLLSGNNLEIGIPGFHVDPFKLSDVGID